MALAAASLLKGWPKANRTRHGWGVNVNLPLAITYLKQAAENSSLVESQALASGMEKGGAAKGELVLAIFELGNCFRNGWGVEKDAVAARSYYEVRTCSQTSSCKWQSD